jgi:hypothetical protein
VNHRPPVFIIAGRPVSGLAAQLHFQQWALAVEQEHNPALRAECQCDDCIRALDAARIFQVGAFDHDAGCRQLLRQSGIRVH